MDTTQALAIFTAIIIGMQFIFKFTGNDKKDLKEEIGRLAKAIDKLSDNLKTSDEHLAGVTKDVDMLKKRHKHFHAEEL